MGIPPIKVEVHNTQVVTRNGTSKGGKDWTMHEQDVWVYLPGEPFPTKALIQVPDSPNGQALMGKDKGVYDLDLSLCLKIGDFHSVALDTRKVFGAMAKKGDLPK